MYEQELIFLTVLMVMAFVFIMGVAIYYDTLDILKEWRKSRDFKQWKKTRGIK